MRTFPICAKTRFSAIGTFPSLRCDAKQSDPRFDELVFLLKNKVLLINEVLPDPFVKGKQPIYIEDESDEDGAFVISTLSVQNLRINYQACRKTPFASFEQLNDARKLRDGDVVLTMDGGTSIGKSAVFNRAIAKQELGFDDDQDSDVYFTVDSHVAILRPKGISPEALVALLASPLGQLQFQRVESGASGQTAVSEDDIRRFHFPRLEANALEEAVGILNEGITAAKALEAEAELQRINAWGQFKLSLLA